MHHAASTGPAERSPTLQHDPRFFFPLRDSESNIIMKRYVIERDIAGVGALTSEQLKDAAATSNAALAKLTGKAQWVESFVADDKTFCIYLADDEAAVHAHAKLSGFPASKVTEVRGMIDPTTATC
jgi:Protein of unknown function (DUF4242)